MKRTLCVILICASLSGLAWAANELSLAYPSSLTLYGIVRNAAGQVWEPAGNAFEAWGASGHTAADYAMALTDKSGAMYVGDLDADLSAGAYTVQFFVQAGGSPADTDGCVAESVLYWSGTASIDYLARIGDPNNSTIAGDIADVKAHLDDRLDVVLSTRSTFDPNATPVQVSSTGVTAVQSGLATASALSTTDGKVDTISTAVVTTIPGTVTTLQATADAIETDTQDLQTQIGTDGAGLTAIGDTRLGNLDAAVSTRSVFDPNTTPVQVSSTGVTAVQSGLATSSALATTDGKVDTISTAVVTTIPATIAALNDPNATAIATAILGATIDGDVTLKGSLELVISWLAGKATVTNNGSTSTISFYKQDGTTIKITITSSNVDGARSSAGVIDP